MDEKAFASYRMTFLHRPDEEMFGFARRDSVIVKQIEASISTDTDNSHAMTLNLQFPEDVKFENIVEIESVVKDRW